MKFAHHRLECPRCFANDVEILKQHDPIAGNIEDSAAYTLAVRGWDQRSKERLEEVELYRVASRGNRDCVGEIAVPLAGVKSSGIFGPLSGFP